MRRKAKQVRFSDGSKRRKPAKQEEDFFESDEEIASSEAQAAPVDPFEDETADERRVRLANQLIEQMEGLEQDRIKDELHRDLQKAKGRLETRIASSLSDPESIVSVAGHRLPACCVEFSPDESLFVTGGKDGIINVWRTSDGSKVDKMTSPDRSAVFCLKYCPRNPQLLAFGTQAGFVYVLDLEQKSERVSELGKHTGAVTGLVWRDVPGQNLELLSSGEDRLIKIWNVDNKSFVDALYGHQAGITCLSGLAARPEIAISSGLDGSVRIWKIAEESQLLFNHGKSTAEAVDCCCFVTDMIFVSGGQDGTLKLWSKAKRKPTHVIQNAHKGEWITSVGAIEFSDLVVSGSSDGQLCFWNCVDGGGKTLKLIKSIEVPGFVNSIQFSPSGNLLAVVSGREMKAGRWKVVSTAQNMTQVFRIRSE
jgi:ribosomal RNA-processing protein 9